MNHSENHSTIKSFVLRQGHFSPSQQKAIEKGMPIWGIDYQPQQINFDQIFNRSAPRILEIGFGMGAATAHIAENHPDKDYLGIEVHGPGVGNLLKLISEKNITNLRIIRHDATEVLQHMIEDDSLDGIHIFFPDPWPKKRHHKRRLIQSALINLIATKLKPGGYLHCATDWEDYAVHILDTLNACPLLINNVASGYAEKPPYRPQTKFEARGLKLGHEIRDIIFCRRG